MMQRERRFYVTEQEMSMEELLHVSMGGFLRVCRCHKRFIEQRISAFGMSENQHHLLIYLEKNPNVSQTHLARELNISTAAVTISLKKLEAEGYLTRSMDEKDNRYNQVEITQKGREIISQSFEIFQLADRMIFRGFSKAELEQVLEYTNRIQENLKSQGSIGGACASSHKKCSTED